MRQKINSFNELYSLVKKLGISEFYTNKYLLEVDGEVILYSREGRNLKPKTVDKHKIDGYTIKHLNKTLKSVIICSPDKQLDLGNRSYPFFVKKIDNTN